MTFNEIPIGTKFVLARDRRRWEWVKVEPVRFPAGHVHYNAQRQDGKTEKFGYSTMVLVPPYEEGGASAQRRRRAQYKQRVIAAGWGSVSEMETAIINGLVELPRKP